MDFGTLADDLGCSPFDNEAYPPLSDSQDTDAVFGVWLDLVPLRALIHPVLYPDTVVLRLALKLFRREPAITRLG